MATSDDGEIISVYVCMRVCVCLCVCVSVCFQDELARVLVTLFDSRHLLYQLLWNMFSKEVELADSMQTLFRGNSLASKIMTFCFKVRGYAQVSYVTDGSS